MNVHVQQSRRSEFREHSHDTSPRKQDALGTWRSLRSGRRAERPASAIIRYGWLFGLLIAVLAPSADAGEPMQNTRSDSAEPRVRRSWGIPTIDRLREREVVQLLVALADGQGLGPGRGWFKAGKTDYGFDWLAVRWDADGDQRITAGEFDGPSEFFTRLDRNQDGAIQADDFDWSDQSPYLRQAADTKNLLRRVDRNGDGRLSAEEWNAAFELAQDGKGHLAPDDLQALLFPPPRPGNRRGPSTLVVLKGLLKGEIGSVFEGPDVGEAAPDFELPTQYGDQTVRLSDFRGDKPVVLIFGSFT